MGVRRMNLDAIDAGLLHTHGSVAKLMRELVDLIYVMGAAPREHRTGPQRTERSGAGCPEC